MGKFYDSLAHSRDDYVWTHEDTPVFCELEQAKQGSLSLPLVLPSGGAGRQTNSCDTGPSSHCGPLAVKIS